MANWAKLQEDTHDMPVHKRARHGIHFKRSDGQIQAEFCGKPCHYLDGGIWKAIDTKLLLMPDGYYGCPHSPVKVHTDGHVRVDGSDYAQYVKLPSASGGLVDGDRIVRSFSFGEQVLRVTENGFRSEIVLNRIPTLAEAKLLIATESGTLPVTYLKSLTTATDANGDSHTFSTLTAFRTWLAGASFPVVIDPDISVNTGVGGDTYLPSGSPTNNYGTFTSIQVSTGAANRRTLIRFDLSSIVAGSTTTAAALKLTPQAIYAAYPVSYNVYKVSDANGDWVEGTKSNATAGAGEPCWNAKAADGAGGVTTAWAGSAGCSSAGTDFVDTVLASITTSEGNGLLANTQYSWTFGNDGYAVLDDWFGDVTNNGFLFLQTGSVQTLFYPGENDTASYRPVLSVTYTAGASTHFMSLLGVGA